MEGLKEALNRYRDITNGIITSVEKKNFENLNQLLDKRESIINHIKTLEYHRDEFFRICSDLMLTTLEEKLNLVMLGARREILSNMNNLSNSRAASASYSKQFNVDPLFFSKKI